MLDDTLKSQLAAYLERVTQPFELVATLGDDDTSRQMRELLQTIQSLRADKITLRTDGPMRASPRSRCSARAPPTACASPACRWAMNSPRWCWRCCGPAATRPRSRPR
jgi:hypothetical protein